VDLAFYADMISITKHPVCGLLGMTRFVLFTLSL